MAKGQVTIPKDVREVLGVTSGDHISFIVEGSTVRIVNSAVYEQLDEMCDEMGMNLTTFFMIYEKKLYGNVESHLT